MVGRRYPQSRKERAFTRGRSMRNSKNGKKNSLFRQNHGNVHLQGYHPVREKSSFRNSKRFDVVGAQNEHHNILEQE